MSKNLTKEYNVLHFRQYCQWPFKDGPIRENVRVCVSVRESGKRRKREERERKDIEGRKRVRWWRIIQMRSIMMRYALDTEIDISGIYDTGSSNVSLLLLFYVYFGAVKNYCGVGWNHKDRDVQFTFHWDKCVVVFVFLLVSKHSVWSRIRINCSYVKTSLFAFGWWNIHVVNVRYRWFFTRID